MRKLPTLAAALLMTATLTSAAAAATILVVSQDGQHQWHSRVTDGNGNPDPSYGMVTFVTGPGTPPRGVGSLRLETNLGKGDGSAQMRSTRYGGVKLSNLTELSYYAYSQMNNGQQFPFLGLNVSNTGGSTTDDILFFEPPYQFPGAGNPTCAHQTPPVMFTWQKWDALSGCWWDNNGELGFGGIDTQPLSTYIALHPNAAIVNANGVGGLRLAVGFASFFDKFDGNIDMVTVGVQGQSISYDFEPPSACKKGDGDGDFEDKDGHKHHGEFHGNSCDKQGGEKDDDDQGRQVDYNGLAPAIYNLTLTNGRTSVGTLVSGTVSLD